MQQLNRKNANVPAPYTERVLQFGGGNFLRAFADWMLDVYNEKANADLGVLLVTPISIDSYKPWQEQDGLYHVLTRGLQNGEVVDDQYLVKSVSRVLHLYPRWEEYLESAKNRDMKFVISNTTEAGIRFSETDKLDDSPPNEFPAKLALWLYHRYQHFQGSKEAGCIFIPVELIEQNGVQLRSCILRYAAHWGLEQGFIDWVEQANTFCNTLVDRIVPGVSREDMPKEWEKLGYEDAMVTQGEAFHFWAIEGPEEVQKALPLDQAGLNVIFTDDLTPYRTRKVRILNGAHTSMVPVGYLYGIETVREAVEHEVVGGFIRQAIFEEIMPTLDLPEEALITYAKDIIDRFRNPFIRHQLISIALNSVSKFKTRVLPSILEYHKSKGALPEALVFSMAALVSFYKGHVNGKTIPLKDDPKAIAFLQELWAKCDGSDEAYRELSGAVLQWTYAWKQDLSQIEGLTEQLALYLARIEKEGMQNALAVCLR